MEKIELFNDHFQNFKVCGIKMDITRINYEVW